MSSSLTLDTLPAEVIQQIAGWLTAKTVLTLLKVNRKLHNACNDDVVFKAVIRNGNGDPTVTPWNIDSFSHIQTGWARLAIADSLARAWPKERTRWLQEDPRKDIPEWAPQLIALHHPLTVDVTFTQLLFDLPSDKWGVYNFCVAAAITHQLTDSLKRDEAVDKSELYRNFLEIREAMGHDQYSEWAVTIVYNTICSNRRPLPPVPYRIPFVELIHLPVPFSEMSQLSLSYLPRMTSASFLTEGEWVGYYSDFNGILSREGRFDEPAMEGIHFQAKPHGEITNALDLSASGTDMHGAFSLKGFICQDGVIEMRKDYVSHGLDWKANMTAFGIMGIWGGWRGEFWLWKKEWSFEIENAVKPSVEKAIDN